jgi:O-acetyl-ADP-ribose deacetylase (regulator of RNase III)
MVRSCQPDQRSVDIEQHECVYLFQLLTILWGGRPRPQPAPVRPSDLTENLTSRARAPGAGQGTRPTYTTGMEIDFPHGKKLRLVIGDITKIRVDAIVNAANSSLAGGGGVDGAIHRAGGPTIMRELDEIRAKSGGCPTGSAVVTTAGALPAQYVFHAVGPIYRDGKHGEPVQLESCYHTCITFAEERDVQTISFPAISTGVYGYPLKEAAGIAIDSISSRLNRGECKVNEVFFVLFDKRTYDIYVNRIR